MLCNLCSSITSLTQINHVMQCYNRFFLFIFKVIENSFKKGKEVKTFYMVPLPNVASPLPWRSVWRTKTHLRLAFFMWTTSLENILTSDNLCKRGIIVID